MAKYECILRGDFHHILKTIDSGILNGSISASFEAGSDFCQNGVNCAIRVYERYSYMGGNRVSMNVTLFGNGDEIYLSGITSGGSQAIFFKMNTIGEENFLTCLENVVEPFRR